ncbi:uncharacterized protein VTP21DRAFT_4171 [Calcarisporiella thermophila]|uniref:uncharacterized protein n=1 Tax=Calcarisporiella thermophila TaxID=911321 RepID=UPI0037425334
MNDTISILAAIFVVVFAFRWLMGDSSSSNSGDARANQQPRRNPVRTPPRNTPPSGSATPDSTARSNSSSISTSTHSSSPSLVHRYKMHDAIQKEDEVIEPPRVWEANPDKRQELLMKRKEYMVLQARKKFLEQQGKSSAASASTTV